MFDVFMTKVKDWIKDNEVPASNAFSIVKIVVLIVLANWISRKSFIGRLIISKSLESVILKSFLITGVTSFIIKAIVKSTGYNSDSYFTLFIDSFTKPFVSIYQGFTKDISIGQRLNYFSYGLTNLLITILGFIYISTIKGIKFKKLKAIYISLVSILAAINLRLS
jgi:hypothetical protein